MACVSEYGDDCGNGVAEVGGCCNGNVNGIAESWDGGAVGLGDLGGIEGTGGKVGGGDGWAGADGTARVGVGVRVGGVVRAGVGWAVL